VKEALSTGLLKAREDIYVTSKISPYEQGTEKAYRACEEILERLDMEYVDLMLIHWPGVAKEKLQSELNSVKRKETWQVLENFVEQKRVRALGVSNYEIQHVKELLSYAKIHPIVNQVECHPLYPQHELKAFCDEHAIRLMAYSCFGAGQLLDEKTYPQIYSISEKTGKTPSQVLLSWGLQKGCLCLAKSDKESRISEFSLSAPGMRPDPTSGRFLSVEDEGILDSLGEHPDNQCKFCWDPAGVK